MKLVICLAVSAVVTGGVHRTLLLRCEELQRVTRMPTCISGCCGISTSKGVYCRHRDQRFWSKPGLIYSFTIRPHLTSKRLFLANTLHGRPNFMAAQIIDTNGCRHMLLPIPKRGWQPLRLPRSEEHKAGGRGGGAVSPTFNSALLSQSRAPVAYRRLTSEVLGPSRMRNRLIVQGNRQVDIIKETQKA